MPNSRPEYRHGRIIWAHLRTAKGKREEHPAVILSPTPEIVQPENFDPRKGGDNLIVVAGISTKYKNHVQPYVTLPFHPSAAGHPLTGLRQDCAMIVGWYQALFLEDDVTAVSGDVPHRVMQKFDQMVFADYVKTVGSEYATSLEMLGELRQALIDRELRREN